MVRNNGNKNLRIFMNLHRVQGKILSRAKRKKQIVFGARSIQKQVGLSARRTFDFDIFANAPKKSAKSIKKFGNKATRSESFYTKKGQNITTWKVKNKGRDMIKGSEDDFTVADFTKMPMPRPKFINASGVRYRSLPEERKAKLKLLKDKQFSFRKEKDLKDLKIINRALRSGISRKG